MIGFENGEPVPIVFPDVEAMDSAAQRLAEELRGKSLIEIAEHTIKAKDAMVKQQLAEERWEAIGSVLLSILDDPKPKLAVRSLMWASGMLAEGNLTLTQIAKMHGTTKQAVQQKGERKRVELNLPLTSFMRSMEARENMRKANFRKPKNGN